jgi:hypothetical protein
VSGLLQYGISWMIEQVKPLRDALDWLAGDAAQIAAHAATWRNVATGLRTNAADLAHYVEVDVATWGGGAGPAYREWSGAQRDALTTLAKAADAMATITQAAGFVIAAVRAMVRDAIAVLVSRLMVYASELIFSGGLASPLVIEQTTTLCAAWSAKIARWLHGLITSLQNLMRHTRDLDHLVGETNKLLAPHDRGPMLDEADAGGVLATPPMYGQPDFTAPLIDPAKITNYAMNPTHEVGKHKYRVINAATGLDVGDALEIERQIRDGVRTGTPIPGKTDEYGQRWAVDVPLHGPKGEITVRTAWIIDTGSTRPRLVTISFPKE